MDPYQVLGVSRNASEDQIKKAYRSLSRKYHPDSNINNPNRERIEEKFKQVQQAYQAIMKERQGGFGSQSAGSYGDAWDFGGFGGFGGAQRTANQRYESDDDRYFKAAENYIRSRSYREALHVLNSISYKSAKWHYYSAIANAGTGNNVTAMEHAKTAVNMEPNNMQYRRLLSQLEQGGSWYEDMGSQYGGHVFSMDSASCNRLCYSALLCNFCCGGLGGSMCCGPSYYQG